MECEGSWLRGRLEAERDMARRAACGSSAAAHAALAALYEERLERVAPGRTGVGVRPR